MYPLQISNLDPLVTFPERGGQIGCISGYISNPSNTSSATIAIYGVNNTGKIIRTIAPNGYLVFRSLEFESIINLSNFSLQIVYSENNDFLLEETQAVVSVGNTANINISSITGGVTIPISGDVNITNSSLTVAGTVNIGNTANINISSVSSGVIVPISGNVNITNTSLTVTGTVDIGNTANINISSITSGVTIPISGNVNITNTSLTVTGTVDIGNTTNINISSITSGVTIPISGSVNITNSSITVAGTVDIGNTANINISSISSGVTIPVSGNINITNTSIAVTGTVDIGNTVDINISTQSGNVAVNVAESIQLPTDIGSLAQQTQETQYSGGNIYTYNPWNFSTGTVPAVRTVGEGNSFCNVQQSGARGYIETMYFCVYNPTSSSASNTITVRLYTHLPVDGPAGKDGFITSFSFSTGTIAATSGAWVTVNPNIFWRYNTLVVIPQTQTGTQGTSVGVMNAGAFNGINSHFWNGSIWNQSDDGFVGFWVLTNASSPNTLPVAVESGNITIERQSGTIATNPNFDTYAAQMNSNGWATQPSYIGITFVVPANSFCLIEDIFFQSNNSKGFVMTDDTVSSNSNRYGLNPAMNLLNLITNATISQANDYISLGGYGQLTAFGVATGSAITSQALLVSGVIHYNRLINTGSNSFTGFVQLSQTNTSNMALTVKCIANAPISFTYASNGSNTGNTSGGGGGGCWTADTLFIDHFGRSKPFSQFREGDFILTEQRFAKITKIIYSGKHEVFKLTDNVWITYPQPFKLPDDGEIKMLTVNDFNSLESKYTDTWDCEVDGNCKWLMTPTGIRLLDIKVP